MIARLLHERHLAIVSLQRMCRWQCARNVHAAAVAEFQAQDDSSKLLQCIVRRKVQGAIGQKRVQKLRREAQLMALGADLQCLDLMSLASDGDVINVPKGRHYPRITVLSAHMSITDPFMYVNDASEVNVGSVVIVGQEHMQVLAKKGKMVYVQRHSPSLLLRIIIAASVNQVEWQSLIEQGQYMEAMVKMFEDLVLGAASSTGGFDRDTWFYLIKISGMNVSNEDFQALWRWWIEWADLPIEGRRPTYTQALHMHLDNSDTAGQQSLVLAIGYDAVTEIESKYASEAPSQKQNCHEDGAAREVTLKEALELTNLWWSSKQRTGRCRMGESVSERPVNSLDSECKEQVQDTLRQLYAASVKVNVRVVNGFLSQCMKAHGPCRRMKGTELVSIQRWLAAVEPLLKGDWSGSSESDHHVEGAMVRGQTSVCISSLISIQAEAGIQQTHTPNYTKCIRVNRGTFQHT